MKRRQLERRLRDHGVELLREGGKHSFWGFDRERSAAVPRHREIKPGTVRAPLPERSRVSYLPGRAPIGDRMKNVVGVQLRHRACAGHPLPGRDSEPEESVFGSTTVPYNSGNPLVERVS